MREKWYNKINNQKIDTLTQRGGIMDILEKQNRYMNFYSVILASRILIEQESYVREKLFTETILSKIKEDCKKIANESKGKNRIEIIQQQLHYVLLEVCNSLGLRYENRVIVSIEQATEIVCSVLCNYLISWVEKNQQMKKTLVQYYRDKHWRRANVSSNDIRPLDRAHKEYRIMMEAQEERTEKLKGKVKGSSFKKDSSAKYDLFELYLFDMYSKPGREQRRQKDGIWRFWKLFFKNNSPFQVINSEEVTKGIREAYTHYDAWINHIQHISNEKEYVIYALLSWKLEQSYRITTYGKIARYIKDKNIQTSNDSLPMSLQVYLIRMLLPFKYKKGKKSISYSPFLDLRNEMIESCFKNDCYNEVNYIYLLRILADLTFAIYNYCYPTYLQTEWSLQDYQTIEYFLKNIYKIHDRIVPMHFTNNSYYDIILQLYKKNFDLDAINYFREKKNKE